MKSKRILLTLGLIVMCLVVISTVSAADQYTDSECKEIATEYAISYFGEKHVNGITQVSSSSSEVVFEINGQDNGHVVMKVSVDKNCGAVKVISCGTGWLIC